MRWVRVWWHCLVRTFVNPMAPHPIMVLRHVGTGERRVFCERCGFGDRVPTEPEETGTYKP